MSVVPAPRVRKDDGRDDVADSGELGRWRCRGDSPWLRGLVCCSAHSRGVGVDGAISHSDENDDDADIEPRDTEPQFEPLENTERASESTERGELASTAAALSASQGPFVTIDCGRRISQQGGV